MSSRLGWLRLVLAALLCVAGVVRPIVEGSRGPSARRGPDPVETRATDRRTELVRVGDRGEDIQGDAPAVLRLVALPDAATDRGALLRAADSRARAGASIDRERARGPPCGSIG